MKILVINAGSSSLKYQLIDMANEQVMAKGLCERQIRYLESVPKAKDVPVEPVQAAAPAAPAAMAADQTRITEPAQGNGDFGSTQMFSL